jgi:hypothetical protein
MQPLIDMTSPLSPVSRSHARRPAGGSMLVSASAA